MVANRTPLSRLRCPCRATAAALTNASRHSSSAPRRRDSSPPSESRVPGQSRFSAWPILTPHTWRKLPMSLSHRHPSHRTLRIVMRERRCLSRAISRLDGSSRHFRSPLPRALRQGDVGVAHGNPTVDRGAALVSLKCHPLHNRSASGGIPGVGTCRRTAREPCRTSASVGSARYGEAERSADRWQPGPCAHRPRSLKTV